MAAKAQTPSFDIAAFLATPATPKQSLLSMLGDKLENVTQRAGYRAGKLSEAVSGTGDIFTLGAKVGEIEAKVRTETFRARAAAEISAALQRMPG